MCRVMDNTIREKYSRGFCLCMQKYMQLALCLHSYLMLNGISLLANYAYDSVRIAVCILISALIANEA
jgi:hypothetical protein